MVTEALWPQTGELLRRTYNTGRVFTPRRLSADPRSHTYFLPTRCLPLSASRVHFTRSAGSFGELTAESGIEMAWAYFRSLDFSQNEFLNADAVQGRPDRGIVRERTQNTIKAEEET